jgi:hypothetical protein
MLCYALREVEFGRQHIENFRAGRANSRLSALITAFVGLQSIDDFQIKRIDYCLCRPSLRSQNLVDRNSTNSGLSVPAGLSACFSYFLPKQFNNVFFTPDFLHGARHKEVGIFWHTIRNAHERPTSGGTPGRSKAGGTRRGLFFFSSRAAQTLVENEAYNAQSPCQIIRVSLLDHTLRRQQPQRLNTSRRRLASLFHR